ncbi:MAG: hypothetical protein IPF78_17670 [Flavobacteriales bacterium]|nr:hypothetical protein [Flavobacteriales bacterium]
MRQLVRQRLLAIGMMGSAEKIKKILVDMRKDGFSEEELGHSAPDRVSNQQQDAGGASR